MHLMTPGNILGQNLVDAPQGETTTSTDCIVCILPTPIVRNMAVPEQSEGMGEIRTVSLAGTCIHVSYEECTASPHLQNETGVCKYAA